MLLRVSREEIEGDYFKNLAQCEQVKIKEYVGRKTEEEKAVIRMIIKMQRKQKKGRDK